MVEVEVLNERKEKTKRCVLSNALEDGDYKLICFIWLINEDNELLIKQRNGSLKKAPNKWETLSGIVTVSDDDSSNAVLRIIKEEYSVKVSKDSLIYVGCYKRVNDFVDVWIVKTYKKNKFNIRRDKVQAIKWVKLDKYQEMIKNGIAIANSYDVLKKYYNNFYNK